MHTKVATRALCVAATVASVLEVTEAEALENEWHLRQKKITEEAEEYIKSNEQTGQFLRCSEFLRRASHYEHRGRSFNH